MPLWFDLSNLLDSSLIWFGFLYWSHLSCCFFSARIISYVVLGRIWSGMLVEQLVLGETRLLDLELVQSDLDEVFFDEKCH